MEILYITATTDWWRHTLIRNGENNVNDFIIYLSTYFLFAQY